MDEDALRGRRLATQRAYYRLVGSASPGAHVLERGGVTAAIVPAVPERSVFNSVVYDDTADLVLSLEEIGAAYEEAGVRAWTVWVPVEDEAAADALPVAGHVLDAEPEAMSRPLEDGPRPDPGLLEDWSGEADLGDVLAVNDRAYPFDDEAPFTRGLSGLPAGEVHAYVARLDGAPAAGLITHDHEGDCGIWAVATLPEARGRGLASVLLAHALADARERGNTTTTLEATQLGRGLYERLGYRPLGVVQMWEKRKR